MIMGQGSVLSPLLFSLYINDVLEKLAGVSMKTLAFADDIVLVLRSLGQAKLVLTKLQDWLKPFNMKMNKNKSRVLVLRRDRRTRRKPYKDVLGIPVVSEARYLGVLMDDCLNFEADLQRRRDLKEQCFGQLAAVVKQQADRTTRNQVLVSLAKARSQYLGPVVCGVSADCLKRTVQEEAQLVKQVHGLPGKVANERAIAAACHEHPVAAMKRHWLKLAAQMAELDEDLPRSVTEALRLEVDEQWTSLSPTDPSAQEALAKALRRRIGRALVKVRAGAIHWLASAKNRCMCGEKPSTLHSIVDCVCTEAWRQRAIFDLFRVPPDRQRPRHAQALAWELERVQANSVRLLRDEVSTKRWLADSLAQCLTGARLAGKAHTRQSRSAEPRRDRLVKLAKLKQKSSPKATNLPPKPQANWARLASEVAMHKYRGFQPFETQITRWTQYQRQ